MGLFGKKDPCAICGGKVKGFFPWHIEGQLVCNDCYGAVDLPNGAVNHMTIEDFRGYMAFREENDQLRQRFHTTQQIDFGWLDDKFLFDMSNQLLCMDKHLNRTIFEGRQIRSFAIKEDAMPLFEGSAAGLVCHTSSVPDRVMAMTPQISQFRMQVEMQRNAERMMDLMDRDRDRDNGPHHRPMPHFDIPEPFRSFNVEIHFDHPYWDIFTADMGGPTFNNTFPDVNDYLNSYSNSVMTMEQLARALMAVAFPGAPEQTADSVGARTANSGASASTMSVDVVEEIQRFKALMDQGIITEEEFTAKKRQLLGI